MQLIKKGCNVFQDTFEDECAKRKGLTLEQWKKEGENLEALYNDNQAAGRHPYKGIDSEKAELLHEYLRWIYGGF